MRTPLSAVARGASSILLSLRETLATIGSALKRRRGSDLVALLMEGSSLERLLDSLASAVFWVLVLAPVLLVPAYYLLASLK